MLYSVSRARPMLRPEVSVSLWLQLAEPVTAKVAGGSGQVALRLAIFPAFRIGRLRKVRQAVSVRFGRTKSKFVSFWRMKCASHGFAEHSLVFSFGPYLVSWIVTSVQHF